MNNRIQEMINRLKMKDGNVTADDVAGLAEMFKDVSVKDCDDMLDRVTEALVAVISLDALKSFDGKAVTQEALAVLLQSPNIQSIPVKDIYDLTNQDESIMYSICVVQAILIDQTTCSYISISKFQEEDKNEKAD